MRNAAEQARVLVVEDNEADRELLEAHLSQDGFETEFAGDGVDGWAMLDANPDRYDLVLLDRTMPRMDGMALLRKIKGDHRFLILPVIFQSALVSREEVIEGIRRGIADMKAGASEPLDAFDAEFRAKHRFAQDA